MIQETGAAPAVDEAEVEIPGSEFTCAVCLDTLTVPLTLRGCGHSFCFLCIHQVIGASLQQQLDQAHVNAHASGGSSAPTLHAPLSACPLCRRDILKMSELVRDEALSRTLQTRFPGLLEAKVRSTHSLALQREAAQRVQRLSAQLLKKRMRCVHAMRKRTISVSERIEMEDDPMWQAYTRREFVMLTVELVGLLYAFLLYVGLVWCKMGRFFSF